MEKGKQMIRHVVLFRLRADVTIQERDSLMASLRKLPEVIPEIRYFEVMLDEVRSERSATYGLLSHFDTIETLRIYQEHPEHKVIAARSAELSEWIKAWDYTIPSE